MNYIKVIFGMLCYAILGISFLENIWDFVGKYTTDTEIKGTISITLFFIIWWGIENFNNTWRHYK